MRRSSMRTWAAGRSSRTTRPPSASTCRRRRTRKTSARGLPGAAVRALSRETTTTTNGQCVFHLHTPKCAGTFVWRFFRDKFCSEAETCKRGTLQVPPACLCAGNPITNDDAVLTAIKRGAYRFVSAHSRQPFSDKCALAVWFREPVSRVRSHYGYVVHLQPEDVFVGGELPPGSRPRPENALSLIHI